MQAQDAAQASYPLDSLLSSLESAFPSAAHDDVVTNVGDPREFELKPSAFREIYETDSPRRVAFVDGGNGTVAQSPGFVISLNRLYCSLFRGRTREAASPAPRVEFFSLVTRKVRASGSGSVASYDAALFPQAKEHRRFLPARQDVSSGIREVGAGRDPRMSSLARSLGEWQMARMVAETLEGGDMLVMDGSLMTLDRTESRYAQDLYETASRRGVIVCALAKTSGLTTRGGEPLLSRVREISSETGYGRWRIDVADRMSAHDRGFVMVVKLHPNAAFSFRFEILREQSGRMDEAEKDHVLASLAANSGDLSFLGYPYGLVDADRYAQVRNRDVVTCRRLLESRMRATPGLSRMATHIRDTWAHEHLNGVSS